MNTYAAVSDALKRGVQPEELCATCPWDRFCITPPSMTGDEVKNAIDKSVADAKKEPGDGPLVAGVMAVLVLGAKDKEALICPVFAVRLRDREYGKVIADELKERMQSLDATTKP